MPTGIYIRTAYHKKKISDSLKEKTNSGQFKIGNHPITEFKSNVMIGIKHPNFTGKHKKYWRKKTLIRDNYTCQICGLCDPEIMEVDHIKPQSIYPELKFKLNNLVTLCPNCHTRKTIREKKEHNYKRS